SAPACPQFSPLSLHDALPILLVGGAHLQIAWSLVFAIAAPTIYTAYILVGESVMGSVPAVGASAVIMTGAGIAFCILAAFQGERSEEHTSELQSRFDLVCRLL